MQHGCRFQAIDLRWGVSEEASRDQQTVKICLEEVKRCQRVTPRPNFIVLLGDRYGWRTLPTEIPADEFEKTLQHVTKRGTGHWSFGRNRRVCRVCQMATVEVHLRKDHRSADDWSEIAEMQAARDPGRPNLC